MDQQTAIQELAQLIQRLCQHLMGEWQPEEYQRRIRELSDIARQARDIDKEVQ
jgi:hypothetical protein